MKARIPARHKVSNKQYKALTEIAKKEVQKKRGRASKKDI